jgi:hypothetical protein
VADEWNVERNVTCVVCPTCAFTFDANHQDVASRGYSCPVCFEAAIRRAQPVRRPLVYIAGPYTHPDPVANTRRAIGVGMGLYDRTDCGVIIPHLSLLSEMIDPRPVDDWYRFDLRILDHCSALYRIAGDSTGADAEVAHAQALGLPVFHEARPGLLADDLLAFIDRWAPSAEQPDGYQLMRDGHHSLGTAAAS